MHRFYILRIESMVYAMPGAPNTDKALLSTLTLLYIVESL